jgi:mannose-6-phosphate isomerase-like protein (cupin superfamily)
MRQDLSERERLQPVWAQRGYSCEIWIDPPRQIWHDSVHDVDMLLHLIEGEAQIDLPGRIVRMHPSDEITVPAGTRHTVHNCNGHPARWLRGYRQQAASANA